MRLWEIYTNDHRGSLWAYNFSQWKGGVRAGRGFRSEADAQAAAAYVMANPNPYERDCDYNPTYHVREMPWKDREQFLFDNGTYCEPVWSNQSWTNDDHYVHYPHVSLEDPNKIAFTEDDAKGEADRQTTMKPGRYLKRFFPNLTAREIAYYAEWQMRGSRPKVENVGELKFAKTPDEIEAVYAEGPSSCMSGNMASCTRVYGAGDLQVAYMVHNDVIMARALCWPEKEAFGRVYPNDGDDDDRYDDPILDTAHWDNELTDRLLGMGWKSLEQKPEGFNGARITYLKHEKHGDGYVVMPYFDLSMKVVYNRLKKCFIVASNDPEAIGNGSTGGWMEFRITPNRCAVSGKKLDRFSRYYNVYVTGTRSRTVAVLTDYMTDEYVWQDYYGHWYLTSRVKRYNCGGRNHVYRDTVRCAITGERIAQYNSHKAKIRGHLRYVSREAYRWDCFVCSYDGYAYLKKDESLVYRGFPRSMDGDNIPEETRAQCHPDYRQMGDIRHIIREYASRLQFSEDVLFTIADAHISMRDLGRAFEHTAPIIFRRSA